MKPSRRLGAFLPTLSAPPTGDHWDTPSDFWALRNVDCKNWLRRNRRWLGFRRPMYVWLVYNPWLWASLHLRPLFWRWRWWRHMNRQPYRATGNWRSYVVLWFTRSTLTHSQDSMWFITVKACKAQSAQRKGAWGKFRGNQTHTSKNSVPAESHKLHIIPPKSNCNTMCDMLSTREAEERLIAQGFHWGLVTLCLACIRLPDGKKVFSINHIICTDSLGTVSQSYQLGIGGDPPEILISRCQLRTKLVRIIAVPGLLC